MIAKYICAYTLVLLAVVSVNAQPGLKIYVQPSGKATSRGTINDPVSDIQKALTIANKAVTKKPVEIILRAGTYFLEETIELTQKTWNSSAPLTIEAYPKEHVVLHGGKVINPAMIKPVSGKDYLDRFLPAVRDKIKQLNLADAGIANTGKLRSYGFSRPMNPLWLELFINSKPGTLARWPNQGTVPIKTLVDSGSVPRWGDTSNRGGIFTYADTDRPSRWKNPGKAWISGYFMWGYADDAVPLKKIDTARKTIYTQTPSYYGFASGKPWRAWYAYNVPEEIDLPGEYYVDEDTRMLYFMAPDTMKQVEVSVLETPMMAIENVKSVTIKNLYFTCSRGMGISMENTEGVTINGCSFTNLGMMAVFMGKGTRPTDLTNLSAGIPTSRTAGNIIQYLYENSTYDRQAGTNNGFINCEIYNTGEGGIFLSGGDRLTLKAGNNFIKNCLIHDYNRIEKTYRPGIWITGVGNQVANCEIYNAPSNGIFLHGNNHLLEYNNLHHLDMDADDMGAVYFGRNPSEQGNIVRYNYLHDIGGGHKTMAVYHDDGACGMQVYGNIFYKAGTVAGFIGGGKDNPYTNNIFINTPFASHIDDRLKSWAKGVLEKGGLFEKRLNAVNYKNPPYATQYPLLVRYWDDEPATPQRNTFSKNLLVNVKQVTEGHAEWLPFLSDNYQTNTDPGFEDMSKQDFRLKKTSVVRTKIPGFKMIPVEKIGYHANTKN
jgi:hypothetical protein